MGYGIHACRGPLHGGRQVSGEDGSRQGQRRLYPRLAHLLLWAVAHSFVAEEKRILRQSHGSVSSSREVLGSTSGGGAHSVRRFRDYRLSTLTEECQGSRAHGH